MADVVSKVFSTIKPTELKGTKLAKFKAVMKLVKKHNITGRTADKCSVQHNSVGDKIFIAQNK